jgi:hypothetical protein
VTAEAQQRCAREGDLRAVLFDDHPSLDRDAVAIGHRLAEPRLDPRLPGSVEGDERLDVVRGPPLAPLSIHRRAAFGRFHSGDRMATV